MNLRFCKDKVFSTFKPNFHKDKSHTLPNRSHILPATSKPHKTSDIPYNFASQTF